MLIVVLALIAYPVALFFVAWRHLGRVDALPADTAATPGRTYLVVGSDSRKGLTKAQRKALHTGGDFGQRTDTIMLLHLPANGGPNVLMSIPRDSYVAIPGHGKNKINAAYAFGGPKLLAETIEKATGVQIDDYAEIGLGGFASMVDAVGGVQICPKRNMKDKDAGLNVKKGCQQANGAVALGYARARHSDPRGDLGRVERQREVLGAIVAKSSKPEHAGQPVRRRSRWPPAAPATLTIDEHTGPVALLRFLLGMKSAAGGDGLSMTVPVSGTGNRPGAGSVVLWDKDQADDRVQGVAGQRHATDHPDRRRAEEADRLATAVRQCGCRTCWRAHCRRCGPSSLRSPGAGVRSGGHVGPSRDFLESGLWRCMLASLSSCC